MSGRGFKQGESLSRRELTKEEREDLLYMSKAVFPSYSKWSITDSQEVVAYYNDSVTPIIDHIPYVEFVLHVLSKQMFKGNKYFRRSFLATITYDNIRIISYMKGNFDRVIKKTYNYK